MITDPLIPLEELRDPLGLPKIGGYIVAYKYRDFANIFKVSWRIDIIFLGPDHRYNAARATFEGFLVVSLISSLEKAYQQMQILERQSFQGEYSKIIYKWPFSKIEVKASAGNICTLVWASSDTHQFSRRLSLNEVEQSINILKTATQRAEHMVDTLRKLMSDCQNK